MRAALCRLSGLSRRLGDRDSVENLVIGGTLAATAAAVVLRELRGRNPQIPGRLVRDNRVHVLTRAGTKPTVVFENGLGHPATMWSWIQQGLPAGVASITYDRPGIGWSPPPRWRSTLAYPESLRATMRALAAYAPFVLVGHSVGGLLIRIFTHHFPDLVGGLVFVDSTHPGQYTRSAAQHAALEQQRDDLDQMIVRSRLGMPPPLNSTRLLHLLPRDVGRRTQEVMYRPQSLHAARRELRAAEQNWNAQAAELRTFGRRPVAVVSAEHSIAKDPVIGHLHQELADLSTVNRSVTVPGADHLSLLTHQPHAAHVTDAVAWVIDQLAPGLHPAGQTQRGVQR